MQIVARNPTGKSLPLDVRSIDRVLRAYIAALSAAAGVETRLATDDDCMQLRDNDVIVVHVR